MKRLFRMMILMLLLMSLTACQAQDKGMAETAQNTRNTQEETLTSASLDFFAMDTYMSLSATAVDAKALIEESIAMIDTIEHAISRTVPESDIYVLNHSEGAVITVQDITYDILSLAVQYAKETDGAFDPTICAITDLWGIGTEQAHVPSEVELTTALQSVSYQNIVLLGDNQVQLLCGAQIDLGGIGKGYAADQIASLYQAHNVVCGVISLAGNVYLYGEKEDDTVWRAGIADPDEPGSIGMSVESAQISLVTTGAYERYFEQDDVRYHHIFDVSTGYPSAEDLKSVTVLSSCSALADAYATALFVMGYEDAIHFAEQHENCSVVLIRADNTVYYSDNLTVTLGDKYADQNE